MSGIALLTYEVNGQKFPQTGLFFDNPDEIMAAWAHGTVSGNIEAQQKYMDGISELFKGSIIYCMNGVDSDRLNILKQIFPNVRESQALSRSNLSLNDTIYPSMAIAISDTSYIAMNRTDGSWGSGYFPTSAFSSYMWFTNPCFIQLYALPSSCIKNGKLVLPEYELLENGFVSIPIYEFLVSIKYDRMNTDVTSATYSGEKRKAILTLDFYNALNGYPAPFIGEEDPYSPGGTSQGGGGGGSFDGSTGNIDFSSLPTIELTDTGFINLFNPSVAQLRQLSDFMWSDSPNWDDLKKILASPMDAIIGLLAVPVNVPGGQTSEVYIGNINTGIYMTKAASQWISHDCGSIVIPEYYGSYLDYSPYTSMQLYLPYIGVQTVSANDILSHAGKTISLLYHVDGLSGACVAQLKCGPDVLYSWQGSCGLQIPFTSLTYGNFLNGLLQVGGGVVQALGGDVLGGLSNVVSGGVSMYHNDISHGGSVSGSGGYLDIQIPYFIVTRPHACIPDRQNTYIGYPSFITAQLADLSGYTRIESIHIENVPATSAEIDEIESLLKNGVIF